MASRTIYSFDNTPRFDETCAASFNLGRLDSIEVGTARRSHRFYHANDRWQHEDKLYDLELFRTQ